MSDEIRLSTEEAAYVADSATRINRQIAAGVRPVEAIRIVARGDDRLEDIDLDHDLEDSDA